MSVNSRTRAAIFGGPMIIGLVAIQQVAARVRTVDILLLFAGGAAFGAGLVGMIRALRSGKETPS